MLLKVGPSEEEFEYGKTGTKREEDRPPSQTAGGTSTPVLKSSLQNYEIINFGC
jgi:hypothetical protein